MDRIEQLERRLERMEDINEILNLMNLYETYHSANRRLVPDKDERFLELWAKKAPNVFLEVGPMGRFDGYEGIRQHTENISKIEEDMTGRFFEHQITTPLIEVAGDAQTAKAMFYSPGLETHLNPKTGEVVPMWCWGRYRADFIKEDGVWKFWRVKFHVHFCTPYAKGGWTEVAIGAAEFVKEDDGWKIWHYRTSPDFSYEIPQENFLAGTRNHDSVHPNPDCPKPNLKLRPLAEEGLYSVTRVPAFSPELPGAYESWDLESSFVCPASADDWQWSRDVGTAPALDNTEKDAMYAANYVEVLSTSSIHCYGYGSQQMVKELDRFWAQRTENLAGCHADRAHQGHDLQYKYYARGNMGMNWGKVKLMHDLFPDKVELHPYNLGIGELVIRFYTSPYIVVADDCKTAQGVWYSFGISSEIDKKAHPVPFMQWGREMCDFVLEGDSWRYLHFRLSADIDYLLDGDIVLGKGLENGIPRTSPAAKPEPDMKLRPFLMDEVYSPFRVADYSPEPPFPFVTWDNRSSWVLPEDIT